MVMPKGGIATLSTKVSNFSLIRPFLSHVGHTFQTAAYRINRAPTPTLDNHSLFFKLFGNIPNYRHLRNFGCLCYPWLRPYTKHKHDLRSPACAFLGLTPTQQAYLWLDPTSNRLYISRHVPFVDHTYPFHQLQSALTTTPLPTNKDWCSVSLPLLTPSLSPPTQPISSPRSPNQQLHSPHAPMSSFSPAPHTSPLFHDDEISPDSYPSASRIHQHPRTHPMALQLLTTYLNLYTHLLI